MRHLTATLLAVCGVCFYIVAASAQSETPSTNSDLTLTNSFSIAENDVNISNDRHRGKKEKKQPIGQKQILQPTNQNKDKQPLSQEIEVTFNLGEGPHCDPVPSNGIKFRYTFSGFSDRSNWEFYTSKESKYSLAILRPSSDLILKEAKDSPYADRVLSELDLLNVYYNSGDGLEWAGFEFRLLELQQNKPVTKKMQRAMAADCTVAMAGLNAKPVERFEEGTLTLKVIPLSQSSTFATATTVPTPE